METDTVNHVTLAVRLPCGCTLANTVFSDIALGKPGASVEFAESSARILGHWAVTRWERHDCALVSPSNPNGITPLTRVDDGN